jgi:hypothetical protein
MSHGPSHGVVGFQKQIVVHCLGTKFFPFGYDLFSV